VNAFIEMQEKVELLLYKYTLFKLKNQWPYMKYRFKHRWALSPIFVISDIGLILISELPISDERAESDIISDIGIIFYPISNIRHRHVYRQTQ
jgi:hypothetical protein